MSQPRLLEIKKNVLDKNDRLAQALRARFQAAGVYVVNLVSSPGTGKTALLEQTLRQMVEQGQAVAALVGEHYGPKPNTAVAAIIHQGTLFHEVVTAGGRAALLSPYP
ncbi:MAG TPA: GTP-binding protein, partial [Anaerolineae bacterium]|nr:GTP-binding protein [Anaerolineae bacterium]